MAGHPGDRPEHPPGSTETMQSAQSQPSSAPVSPTVTAATPHRPPPAEMPKTPPQTPAESPGQDQRMVGPPTAAAARPGLTTYRRASPSTSTLEGQQRYAGLTFQKRSSLDEGVRQRKVSWREQPVGSNPQTARWFTRWWDT
ncbi:predicted protein [Uncinocarpus reesii 1704]|uniref:Uncharacterized protein n=1 Tax=Uncinocarpus reesii (strain UAMH 1704) TaxID=336963 RepID=C4JUE3_UNCRE|nr:uncharacterized protein UREG_04746 [Uncinocarpus reesii 1704]EEP79904.1 predicted protein [Uncinocarpus reesii 1704]